MKRLYIIALLLLTSCAAPPPKMVWMKPTGDDTQFPADRYACLQQASAATPPATAVGVDPLFGNTYSYDVNADNRDNLFTACMAARNWQLVQAAPAIMAAK